MINTITNHGIFFIRMLDGLGIITGTEIELLGDSKKMMDDYYSFLAEPIEYEASLDFSYKIIVGERESGHRG